MNPYYGKYRGKVENNVDPQQQGRVQVSCPAVLGDGRSSWAMPSAPYGGSGVGFFAVPPAGANVWVEFEGGDPDYPIWSGCFWGLGEAPATPALAELKVWKTDAVTLTLDDTPGAGGFKLEVLSAAGLLALTMDANGITLANGGAKIQMTPASVSVNEGALEVI
ncbi:MAG: baseplate assembly protein [bacterium]|nr:baseplate assembly protein [bacterium]